MFEENRRVKAIKLRGVKSNGFFCSLDSLSHFGDISNLQDGDRLDEFCGIPVCCKYVSKRNPRRNTSQKSVKKKELCFPEHKDTSQLKYNLGEIKNGDELIITLKVHGCVDKDTIVNTLEYGDLTIKEVVDQKLNCKIKARDIEMDEDVYVDIDQHYFKEDSGEWYEIELEDGRAITITGNNPVWLPEINAYRRVDELSVDDICLVD